MQATPDNSGNTPKEELYQETNLFELIDSIEKTNPEVAKIMRKQQNRIEYLEKQLTDKYIREKTVTNLLSLDADANTVELKEKHQMFLEGDESKDLLEFTSDIENGSDEYVIQKIRDKQSTVKKREIAADLLLERLGIAGKITCESNNNFMTRNGNTIPISFDRNNQYITLQLYKTKDTASFYARDFNEALKRLGKIDEILSETQNLTPKNWETPFVLASTERRIKFSGKKPHLFKSGSKIYKMDFGEGNPKVLVQLLNNLRKFGYESYDDGDGMV